MTKKRIAIEQTVHVTQAQLATMDTLDVAAWYQFPGDEYVYGNQVITLENVPAHYAIDVDGVLMVDEYDPDTNSWNSDVEY